MRALSPHILLCSFSFSIQLVQRAYVCCRFHLESDGIQTALAKSTDEHAKFQVSALPKVFMTTMACDKAPQVAV